MKIAIGALSMLLLVACSSNATVTVTAAPTSSAATSTTPASIDPAATSSTTQSATGEPATPATTAASKKSIAVGQDANITKDGAVIGTFLVEAPRWSKTPSDATLGEKPKNGWYALVPITITGAGAGIYVNPLEFYVRGPDGQRYSQDGGNSFTEAIDQQLNAAQLAAGEKVKGLLAFDCPKAGAVLVYAPVLGDTVVAEWPIG